MAPIKPVVSVPLTWYPSPGTPTCGCVAQMQSGEEGQDGLDLRFWPLRDPPPSPPTALKNPATLQHRESAGMFGTQARSLLWSLSSIFLKS